MTNSFVINKYFTSLKKPLDDLDLYDKPLNMDETSLCMDLNKTKVAGEKGKPSTRVLSGPGRENTTTVNAAGKKSPPLVIFKASLSGISGLLVHILIGMFLKENLCIQRAPRGRWKRKSLTTILNTRFCH